MNFDFSDDLKQLRDQSRRFVSERCTPAVVRRSLDGEEAYAAALWREIAEMGWIGAAIPEEFGGAGLGYEGLCVLAEEMGRAVAPVPFGSTAYLAAEAILTAGSDADRLSGALGRQRRSRILRHSRPRRGRSSDRHEMARGGWWHRRYRGRG